MRFWDRRRLWRPAIGLALAAVTAACGAATSSRPTASPAVTRPPAVTAKPHRTPVHQWPRPAWVAVPVTSVWNKLDSARPVDAADVSGAPEVGRWLDGMTFADRLDLDNRLATQALLNDPVLVLGETHGWAQVLVSGQKGAVYRTGIAGWVPAAQLTFHAPPATGRTVTVALPLIRAGSLTLSYGTKLPAVGQARAGVVVATPAGRVVLPAGITRATAPPATGQAVVGEAERFLGLPYLWAGTSGWGFDCSGLTYMVYRQFGVTLPRDAADQARAGRPVALAQAKPGDLLFFTFEGATIDHVGMYVGRGLMLDAPRTGKTIEIVPLSTPGLGSSLTAVRRYL